MTTSSLSLHPNSEQDINNAKIFCGVLRLIAPYISIKIDEHSYVIEKDALAKLEEALGFEEEYILTIYKVLISTGHLTKTSDPTRKVAVISLSSIEKLGDFVTLIRSSKTKKTQKLLEHNFSDKTLRVGKAICLYAKHMKLNTEERVTISGEDFDRQLLKITGTPFDREALKSLIEMELIEYSKTGDAKTEKLIFLPKQLNRTLLNVSAYKKFETMGRKGSHAA